MRVLPPPAACIPAIHAAERAALWADLSDHVGRHAGGDRGADVTPGVLNAAAGVPGDLPDYPAARRLADQTGTVVAYDVRGDCWHYRAAGHALAVAAARLPDPETYPRDTYRVAVLMTPHRLVPLTTTAVPSPVPTERLLFVRRTLLGGRAWECERHPGLLFGAGGEA